MNSTSARANIRSVVAALVVANLGVACGQVVSTTDDARNSTAIDAPAGSGIDPRPGTTIDASPSSASCGNGVVDPGEQCDDMNSDNTDNCLSTCVDITSGHATSYMVAMPTAGAVYFVANELDVGSNTATQVMPQLPDGSGVSLWSPVTQTWTAIVSDAGSPSGWDDTSGAALANAPILAPGTGFVVEPAAGVTLTFSGSQHTPSLPLTLICGGKYNLLSRQTADAGDIDTLTGYLIAENANGAYNGYGELIWTGETYTGYLVDSTSNTGWTAAAPTSQAGGTPMGLVATSAGPVAAPPELAAGQPAFIYCP